MNPPSYHRAPIGLVCLRLYDVQEWAVWINNMGSSLSDMYRWRHRTQTAQLLAGAIALALSLCLFSLKFMVMLGIVIVFLWNTFIATRESRPHVCLCVCVYIPRGYSRNA